VPVSLWSVVPLFRPGAGHSDQAWVHLV
jgi:hypothetical protein